MYKSKSTVAIIGVVSIFLLHTFSQDNPKLTDKSSNTVDDFSNVDRMSDRSAGETCNIPLYSELLLQTVLCQTSEITNPGLSKEPIYSDVNKNDNKSSIRFPLSRLLGLGTTICNILLMKLQRRTYLLFIFITSVSMSLMTMFV